MMRISSIRVQRLRPLNAACWGLSQNRRSQALNGLVVSHIRLACCRRCSTIGACVRRQLVHRNRPGAPAGRRGGVPANTSRTAELSCSIADGQHIKAGSGRRGADGAGRGRSGPVGAATGEQPTRTGDSPPPPPPPCVVPCPYLL